MIKLPKRKKRGEEVMRGNEIPVTMNAAAPEGTPQRRIRMVKKIR